MDPALAALDFAKAGAILADMVASCLAAGALPLDPEGPDDHDLKDRRSTPVEAGLHLCSPVDAGAGPFEPGEHGPPIQSVEQGAIARLEGRADPGPRPRSRTVRRSSGQADFKALVGDVAMGQIGAIFALEASRLARSNQDWHRLLELCAITGTLVIDEDGCYDPAEFNDSLVLGMKGTFAQAELHIIRARLHGGKLNKASRGELRFPSPVGFVFEGDKIVLDPDREVQGAVRMVFDLFEREGTAYSTVWRFQELGLRFPAMRHTGSPPRGRGTAASSRSCPPG